MKVKTRKDHQCSYCKRIIKKGSVCSYFEGRAPVLDEDYYQIGIEYWKAWVCLDDEECEDKLNRQDAGGLRE